MKSVAVQLGRLGHGRIVRRYARLFVVVEARHLITWVPPETSLSAWRSPTLVLLNSLMCCFLDNHVFFRFNIS